MVVQSGDYDVTVYVFDSGPLIILFNHFYRERFPSLWKHFDEMIEDCRITSTREVFNELKAAEDTLASWCKVNREKVFITPTAAELAIVTKIFNVPHFQMMIRKKERLQGRPVADPFVIARAKFLENACVVTTEKDKPNAAQIPNVCKHFDVDCVDLEGFMKLEKWRF